MEDLKFTFRSRCGARTRHGKLCPAYSKGGWPCKMHGGATRPLPSVDGQYRIRFRWRGVIGTLAWSLDRRSHVDWSKSELYWQPCKTEFYRGRKRLDIRNALGHNTLRRIETGDLKMDKDNGLEIEIRLATPEDIAEFVIPSWLQSYTRSLVSKLLRADGRFSSGRDLYWSSMRKRVEKILSTPGVRVIVAAIDDTNIGWACEDRSGRILHYVYVKDAFRKQGIGRNLVGWIDDAEGGLVRLTHLPPPWYSKPQEVMGPDRKPIVKNLWKSHVVIDLVSDI